MAHQIKHACCLLYELSLTVQTLKFTTGQEVLHVDANVFSGKDYKLAWLLLLPAWNLLKGIWQSFRQVSWLDFCDLCILLCKAKRLIHPLRLLLFFIHSLLSFTRYSCSLLSNAES